MATDEKSPFAYGSTWIRADFHLHTKADKEFKYDGDENAFVGGYVDALKKAGIGLAVITNHNKFDADEFKALRKRARKEEIGLLPGIELSVNDGSNGVHTLIVFSDEWLADGHDLINQFLGTTFAGKPKAQYEQENGRSNDNLVETLKKLEKYDRDFFVVFAHVEANSGLWAELDGGRLTDLSNEPLIKKYCLGFQKVRTHDKGGKCRVKVQSWWHKYPAEVEGSDAKKFDEIGRGQQCFLKMGDLGFDAVKFALTDSRFRVGTEMPKLTHSHVNAVRFEGGLLDGIRVPFSPHMNCLIGIQGSGKALKSHSLGQRASAMMLFLLSQDDHDLLLIDQPEDDLDSQTVYEEVVKLVREIKKGRQFILATHNANFPVLGDSEIVAACAHEETISVVAGSIDTRESQGKIVSIMEGGKEAFQRRKTIYEIWDAAEA
jgi:hypothetical protein